jgi:CRP-like cAMP-binding protein
MPSYASSTDDLQTALHRGCKKIWKAKSSILFRRGQSASGMFVVLRGTVTLDFGVDGALAANHTYGPGALVGMPAALTKRSYSMTATVTQDAELGFWPAEALDALSRKRPDLCRQLLAVLGERISQTRQVAKAFLNKEEPTAQRSSVDDPSSVMLPSKLP